MEKIALVTGASRGLGAAIAMALAKRGVRVMGTATTEQGAQGITKTFEQAGLTGMGMAMNVTDDATVTAVLERIQSEWGAAPNILINNAGITRDDLMMRMKPEAWDAVIQTNLTGVFKLTQACVRPMMKARWGRIVSIGSVVGTTGNPGQSNYTAAKAGVVGFTKSIAMELAPRGITTNVVAPGFIETDMTAVLSETQKESILSRIPMKSMGSPEDIAAAVAFLVSDEAAYITGHTLHVNGGMSMNG